MKNECQKCNVVHNFLVKRCFNCGDNLDNYETKSFVRGLPTLLTTTGLSLTVVVSNLNLVRGS